jgi:hypothetical protein
LRNAIEARIAENPRLLGDALRTLESAGCFREIIIECLCGYLLVFNDATRAKRINRDGENRSKRSLKVAQAVRRLADTLDEAENCSDKLLGFFATATKKMMFGDRADHKLELAETVFQGYGSHMHDCCTQKKAKADHFLLVFLVEYVRAVSGKPHFRELIELLNATWRAGGIKDAAWTTNMVEARMKASRRPPFSGMSISLLVKAVISCSTGKPKEPIDYLYGAPVRGYRPS